MSFLFTVLLAAAAATTVYPQMHCEAYGHVVECQARDTADEAIMWAAVWNERDGEHVYRSAGDSFGFRLKAKTEIEMHLPYVGGFSPLRLWAEWRRGRVVFYEWQEPKQP